MGLTSTSPRSIRGLIWVTRSGWLHCSISKFPQYGRQCPSRETSFNHDARAFTCSWIPLIWSEDIRRGCVLSTISRTICSWLEGGAICVNHICRALMNYEDLLEMKLVKRHLLQQACSRRLDIANFEIDPIRC